MPLDVDIVSTERSVWTGAAEFVVARTVNGELGILPSHAPLLAALIPCEIRITPVEGDVVIANCGGGFLSVEHDRVTIISDCAELGPMKDSDSCAAESDEKVTTAS